MQGGGLSTALLGPTAGRLQVPVHGGGAHRRQLRDRLVGGERFVQITRFTQQRQPQAEHDHQVLAAWHARPLAFHVADLRIADAGRLDHVGARLELCRHLMRNDLPAVHTSDRYRYITALADKIDLDPHTTLTEAIDDLVPDADADAIAIQAGEARLVVDQAHPDNHQQPDAADVSDQAPDDAAHDLYPTRHTPEGINR